MLAAATVSFADAKPEEASGDVDYFLPNCQETPFCDRHRYFESEARDQGSNGFGKEIFYSLDRNSIVLKPLHGQVQAQLNLSCALSGYLAKTLDLTLTFY